MPTLEPGRAAKPKRKRKPSPEPEMLADAMVSLNEGLPKSARFATRAEAEEYKHGIDRAVYWIRQWGAQVFGGDPQRYKVRGNPFVSEHYVINGVEYDLDADELGPADTGRATDHYFKCNFYLRQPEMRGMAVLPPEQIRKIQQAAIDKKRADAAARAAATQRSRRTVAIRGD